MDEGYLEESVKRLLDETKTDLLSLINLDLFLEGPEDDSKESKHVALK